jgi:hypothetical protein
MLPSCKKCNEEINAWDESCWYWCCLCRRSYHYKCTYWKHSKYHQDFAYKILYKKWNFEVANEHNFQMRNKIKNEALLNKYDNKRFTFQEFLKLDLSETIFCFKCEKSHNQDVMRYIIYRYFQQIEINKKNLYMFMYNSTLNNQMLSLIAKFIIQNWK